MSQSAEEIAQIIKIGTTAMLTLAFVVIGMVLYFHQKMVKARFK
jgi:heme/copper-type cytochrome/quinol oxidase subunit 2